MDYKLWRYKMRMSKIPFFGLFWVVNNIFDGKSFHLNPFSHNIYEKIEDWGRDFPQCSGDLQSPIHLKHSEAVLSALPPLKFINYNSPFAEPPILFNSGRSVNMIVPRTKNGNYPCITGGLLTSTYEACQVHFHWGGPNHPGSEHMINGNRTDVEIHIVHKNQKYRTVPDALKQKDGLAVLGVTIKITPHPKCNYPGLSKILNALSYIVKCETKTSVKGKFSLGQLLGDIDTSEFFAYYGSLTTPACNEVVTWHVFPKPLPVCYKLVKNFWHLHDKAGKPIMNNFRHLQPRNNRDVFYRFDKIKSILFKQN